MAKNICLKILIVSIIIITFISCASIESKNRLNDMDEFYGKFIEYLRDNLPVDYDLKFAAIPFNENNNEVSDFGRYISETIASKIVMEVDNSSLYERENLEKILDEQELAVSGLFDEDEIKRIGKLIPVNAIFMGNYTLVGDNITINCRITDVSSGEIILAYYATVLLTDEYRGLLGLESKDNNGEASEKDGSKNAQTNSFLSRHKNLRVYEQMIDPENYTMLAEDGEKDFSKSYSFGVDDDPAGDIKSLLVYEDGEYFYFLITFQNDLELDEINTTISFWTPEESYDEYAIHINAEGKGRADIYYQWFNGDAEQAEPQDNLRFRFDRSVELKLPKAVLGPRISGILLQTRNARYKEIDRLQIKL